MATADDAAAQLWAAVRGFSDAELGRVQRSIRQFLCAQDARPESAADAASSAQDAAVELQLGAKTQRVRADDFVHVFLDYLHGQVQRHADARVSSDSEPDRLSNLATPESNMATLQDEDQFPQLKRTPSSGQVAPAKTPKRRITTTLLTPKDSTVVARPVPVVISFPPLGASEGTRPPAWAKQSLLEKRMGAAAPSSSSSFSSNTPATPSAWGPKPSVPKPTAWGSSNTSRGVMATPVVKKKTQVATTIVPKKKLSVETVNRPQQLSVRKKSPSPSNQVTDSHSDSPKKSKQNLASTLNQQEEAGAPVIEKSRNVAILPDRSSDDFKVNKQAAKLYGFLIRERFVKSTSAELQVLISLLYRADCAACSDQPESSSCSDASEFCWRVHCLDFAEIVFCEIEQVLAHLGADLLALVKHSLRDAEGICASMLERLDEVSRRREEFRVAESARVGCQLPIEMKASAVRDFAIPFNEETDSRLHYRTPEESLLYTNREKVRDGFLGLLRQFQQKQHSLVGIENAGVAATAIAAARELLAEVSPENRWWFAKFFVQELVQVGSNPFGESDKDLVLKIMADKLVVKNPDRLRKLHRRFSSQKPSNKSPQAQVHATGGGSNNNKNNGKSNNNNNSNNNSNNNNSLRKNRQDTRAAASEDDATKSFTATLDRMRSFFTDNQLFFFHFLHSCDSYEFSELVKHQLERQFYSIRETISPSADARKDFTEVVLRLKVVAKFLGYLRFSPQWQVTCSIRQLSAHNAAFKAVEREGISTLEAARDSSLDVKKLLEESILESSISKCVPWLCDYLSMLSLDKLSFGTTYFKQLVVLLHHLHRSPRLSALGETGLYVALQIERIFRVLKLDAGFLHGEDYQSRDLLPSSRVRVALESEDDTSPEAGAGEDHLPFLYSQVFVQSCVSELEDLRGFIQTRAQPTPRRKLSIGSGSMTTNGHPVTPMRKLRPLQVVIEDGDTSSSFGSKHDDVVRAASPGVKAPASGGFPSTFPPVQEENDELSEAVFKVHPKLKAVVEFVVGSVTTDVCEHVMAHVVTPRADGLVDHCASESGLLTVGRSPAAAGDDAALAARASFQMMITSKTRHEANSAVVASLQEALRLGEERVSAAVPPFLPPSSHATLTNSIVSVALQRTRGALKTLVPKSCQSVFVKRVAFRNKSLLKDLGAGSKVAAVALPSSAAGAVAQQKSADQPAVQEDAQRREEERRYRGLRRCSAAIFRNASLKSVSLAAWEHQAAGLSQCLGEFTTSLRVCVESGDVSRSTSPLRGNALVLWDLTWRAVTSCLKSWGSSLDVFAACELASMKEARVQSVEKMFSEFVASFTTLLTVVVRCSGEGADCSRLQSMLTFVLDSVVGLPSRADHAEVVERLAVQARSHFIAELRSCIQEGDNRQLRLELDWDRWTEPRNAAPKNALTPGPKSRQDGWNAVTPSSVATTAA